MKHVLVLNQFALPQEQSGGTRHVDLFGRLQGWQPTIVAGNRNYNTQDIYTTKDPRFRLVRVPSYRGTSLIRMIGWALFAIQAAFLGATRPKVDAVYASSPNMLVPVAGWFIARVRRVPLTVEIRDLWPESIIGAGALRRHSRLHAALVRLERWIYDVADQIVVVTPGWEQHFAQFGISADKVAVIPNGTEVADFDVDEDRDTLRAEFGLTKIAAVYAGAHGPANALQLIIDTARQTPNVDFLLIGSGSEKEKLKASASGLDNVRFLDPVPKTALARILAAADIGIHCIEPLPVLTTGMSPNKLFDYMAAGLTTVSNAGEGVSGIVADGDAGHTGPAESLPDLVAAVVAAGPEQRSIWGRKARSIVVERFSRSGAARRLEEVLAATSAPADDRHRSRPDVVHLTTAHRVTDNRIFRKECTALRDAGIEVHLVAPATRDLVVDDIAVHALPVRSNRFGRMTLGAIDAYRLVRLLAPNVLHVHDPELIPMALAWQRRTGGRIIFDSHEDLPKQVVGKPYLPRWSHGLVSGFARGLEHLADRRFDAVVAATPTIMTNFQNPRTTLVQNYPWLRDFPDPQPFPSAQDRGLLAYVGGISRGRGSALMAELPQRTRHATGLLIAGSVASESTAHVTGPGIEYHGILAAEDIPELLGRSHIGLSVLQPLPNYLTAQATKMFEYMAAGRPFIASDFPAWVHLFGPHNCGIFVDPNDTDSVAAAVDSLLDDVESAQAMGRRGRKAIEGTFNFEIEGDRLVALTRDLLAA